MLIYFGIEQVNTHDALKEMLLTDSLKEIVSLEEVKITIAESQRM